VETASPLCLRLTHAAGPRNASLCSLTDMAAFEQPARDSVLWNQVSHETESAVIAATGSEPSFYLGPIPIYGRTGLAPMAGFSDVPYRLICREMGAALGYTACVMDNAIVHGSKLTPRLLDFREQERPLGIQLLGRDEDRLLEACEALLPSGPDFLDINLGCPARRVTSHGRGAALLREPEHIGRLVAALVRRLPIPVTAKIRLGWDNDSLNYMQVVRILEESGVALIAVHGRTRAQGYSGNADWEAIREIKASATVPILGNGDVRSSADVEAMSSRTGCDGVLIGRGAIGNPWVFAGRDRVSHEERLAMIERHLKAMTDYYGEHRGLVLFRKHVVRYVRNAPGSAAVRAKLMSATTASDMLSELREWGGMRGRAEGVPDSSLGTAFDDERHVET